MIDVFNLEMISEQLHDLFSPEMVPSSAVPIAETDHQVRATRLYDPVYALDEGCSISRFHVVKTPKIKNEIKLFIGKREAHEVPYEDVDADPCLTRFLDGQLYCPVRYVQGGDVESSLCEVDRVRPRTTAEVQSLRRPDPS